MSESTTSGLKDSFGFILFFRFIRRNRLSWHDSDTQHCLKDSFRFICYISDLYILNYFHLFILVYPRAKFDPNVRLLLLWYPSALLQKKHYSAVASNLSKAFKGASFTERKSDGERNAALEKEGELFVHVLHSANYFTAGVSFATFYIKVVQYKGGNIVNM
jgi:hypothetical protein